MTQTDLVVIGAGVTGSAIARDAAMRGIRTTVIESGQVGAGTSGRFHSMLQSGSRYVVTDTVYAAECMRERLVMERIAPFARTATEGLFVAFDEEDLAFAERFAAAGEEAEIPVNWLDPAQIAAREPALSATKGGFVVPDAVFRPWELVPAIAASAMAHGAEFLTGTTVTEIVTGPDGLTGVRVRTEEGQERLIESAALVIAAGAWAADLGAQAGLKIEVETAKGAMLVVPGERVNSVVNRLRPPQSFDIAVPLNGSTVFGTTSSIVDSAADVAVTPEEFTELSEEFLAFLPGAVDEDRSKWTAYAGVRPLVSAAPGEGGAVSRKHAVFSGSVANVFGVVGGSFTTHRAMAEDVVDRVARNLDVGAESRTAYEQLAPAPDVAWSAASPMQSNGIGLST
ncbi:FAD-dependent oxidoreductase [Streptomyces hirsutus]|uniref:FAD-dependent oxidoreductase n=1 Tax=Streptomyces hirsutus TaxID=35620 RepID=UPI00365ED302